MNEPKTVLMTVDEREHLLLIYKKRLRLFVAVFAFMIAEAVIATFRYNKKNTDEPYDYEVFGHVLVGAELFVVVLCFILAMIIPLGIRLFLKRIYPYKKDADLGRKEVITKTVTDKKYFPNTNQFFLSFDDPNYMHHEVDSAFYLSVEIGSHVALYRGLYSKYVFQKDGRFTLM